MAEKEKFYSFEQALKELRLKEEELKRLVSEGEIRAFRDGDTMKLRRADVETLRNELSGDPMRGEVVDLGEGREELVFEDEAMADEAGMATEEISNVDTIIAEDDVEDVGEIEIEETVPVAAATTVRRAPVRTAAVVEVEENEGAAFRAAMVATTFVLVLAIPVTLSASAARASGIAKTIAEIFGNTVP